MRRGRLALWLLMLAGCQPEGTLEVAGDGSEMPRWAVSETLDEAVDELGVGPVVEPGTPFGRLALRWDAAEPAALQVRVRDAEGAWSEWRPVEVTWSEAGMHVGVAALSGDALAYQVRVESKAQAEIVAGLEVEAVPVVPGSADELPADPGEQTIEAPDLGELIAVDPDDERPADPAASVELKSARRQPRVVSRSAWGARAPRCSYGAHRPNRVTIHHTVTPTNDSMSPAARVRQIQAFHINGRGWCDVGYHFLVARDGRIYQGRPHTRLGAHVGNANSGNVGISLLGSFDTGRPSQAQLCAAASLVGWLGRTYGIPRDRAHVKGHRQYGGTSCPGGHLYSKLGNIVSMARAGECSGGASNGGGGQQARPPAQPEHGVLKGIVYAGGDTDRRIAGATVRLSDGRTTRSNAEGLYQFRVAPGRYSVTVTKSGWETARSAAEQVRAGTTRWESVSLRREAQRRPTGTLVGVVYRHPDSSQRIAGAQVTLSTGHTVRTNDHGVYRLQVPAGEVRVRAEKAGYGAASVERTVPRGGEVWGSVGLRAR